MYAIDTTSANPKHTFNAARKFTPTEADVRGSDGPEMQPYSYRPAPQFMGGDANTCLMYGVELELDNFSDCINPRHLSRYMHETMSGRVYCKSDGSLRNGVEIVSHPATLSYHMRKFGWADVLGIADEMGAKSHNTRTCGLHVHVGRAALGNTDDARELCIAKLLILTEKFYDRELLAFSRRDSREAMEAWAKKSNAGITENDKKASVLRKAKDANCNRDRYHALNLTNSNTIEFRAFRGTLNPMTFAATLQFVDAMVKYCKTRTLQQVVSCTFGDVVGMCNYPELAAYCERRGIDLTTSPA